MPEPPPRQPQLGDSDYDFAAFRRDLLGGGLRWRATVLAALNAALLALIYSGLLSAQIHWPFHATGSVARWLLITTLIVWTTVAAVNWSSHGKTRRSSSRDE